MKLDMHTGKDPRLDQQKRKLASLSTCALLSILDQQKRKLASLSTCELLSIARGWSSATFYAPLLALPTLAYTCQSKDCPVFFGFVVSVQPVGCPVGRTDSRQRVAGWTVWWTVSHRRTVKLHTMDGRGKEHICMKVALFATCF